jgi:hypothetical protein
MLKPNLESATGGVRLAQPQLMNPEGCFLEAVVLAEQTTSFLYLSLRHCPGCVIISLAILARRSPLF